ncbi:hypothetical protein [Rhodoferax sp. WC2427]|uniref:hypothetical protein n=1 Tax=Rhodoferax sp. WC2427 TaxID=3234144 RepID=UPI00346661F7
MSDELQETLSDTAVDADGAYTSIRALLELLHGCPPEYPLSAGLFVGLVEGVGVQMANVVDGLRVARHTRFQA